jgi:hypothetical protein
MVAAFDRDKPAPARAGHGDLQRDLDRFRSAGGAIALPEVARCDRHELRRQLVPARVPPGRIDAVGAVERADRLAQLFAGPAELAAGPPGREIDVPLAPSVEEQASFRSGDVQLGGLIGVADEVCRAGTADSDASAACHPRNVAIILRACCGRGVAGDRFLRIASSSPVGRRSRAITTSANQRIAGF